MTCSLCSTTVSNNRDEPFPVSPSLYLVPHDDANRERSPILYLLLSGRSSFFTYHHEAAQARNIYTSASPPTSRRHTDIISLAQPSLTSARYRRQSSR
jgi:hypothetical protein